MRTIEEHNAASAKKGVLTEQQVRLIKQRLLAGDKPRAIAVLMGVSEQTIGRIRDGRTWAWVKVKANEAVVVPTAPAVNPEESLGLLAKAIAATKQGDTLVNEIKGG